MDRTKRGRACEQELRRLNKLISEIPQVSPPKAGSRPLQKTIIESDDDAPVAISSLVRSGCSVVDGCVEVLSTLVRETDSLVREAHEKHLPALLLYADNGETDECAPIRLMTAFLPALLELSKFLERIYVLFRNLLLQVRAFHLLDTTVLPDARGRRLTKVWQTLGDLLALLIHVDEITTFHPIIRQHWNTYARALEATQYNPSQFSSTEEQLRPLLTAINRIEYTVMTGNALRNCYEQSFGELDEDMQFAALMKDTVSELLMTWEKAAEVDVPDKRRLMALVGLTAFYYLHFTIKDTKLLKNVWNTHKKIVIFHLVGDILWSPCSFLHKEVSEVAKIADKKTIQFIQQAKIDLFTEQGEAMLNEAVSHFSAADEWIAQTKTQYNDSAVEAKSDAANSLVIADHILKGARIADTMCRLLKTILNSSSTLRLSKAMAYKVFGVIEKIKAIGLCFSSNWQTLSEAAQMACQQWRCHALAILDRYRTQLRDAGDVERSACFRIAVDALLCTTNRTRITIVHVAMEVGQYRKVMKAPEVLQVDELLMRLETLMQPRRLVERVTNCSFTAFQPSLIAIFFDTILERMPSDEEIELYLAALDDCAAFTSLAKHDSSAIDKFYNATFEAMRKGFLIPLSEATENDLRLLTHAHLQVDERDKTSQAKYEFLRRILASPPWRIYERFFSPNEFVSRSLEETFYNLTVVALHDCHTYNAMALMAKQRYDLDLVNGHLTHHSLNQGLDVIEVMKSLGHFVTHYNYCLNQQVFIEKQSPNRSLKILSAEQMASSLRSHGLGVLNTSVNVTYQLLRKQFVKLHQILGDEHIRAQLKKDIRYFEEHRNDLNKMYPYKRAEKFHRSFVKLDVNEDDGDVGETVLDRCRNIVTQMGNALGFVRTLSSGAEHVSSQLKECDMDEVELQQPDLANPSQNSEAKATLQEVLEEIRTQTGRNRNFIKLLIEVFQSGLSDREKFGHFPNFFILVPALTLNFVEHMLTCRDRLKKRQQHTKEMTFIDDGFVMGVTYLLTVFDVWPQVTSLNWFRSVLSKCDEDIAKLGADGGNTAAPKDHRSNALKHSRIAEFTREIKLLSYTFQSARVFFSVEDE